MLTHKSIDYKLSAVKYYLSHSKKSSANLQNIWLF